MGAGTTNPSLLSRVRDMEDQEAWREFESTYRELILRYGRASGLQAPDAEDVRQIVMVSLSRSLQRFQYRPELGRFRDYLGRIVRNAVHRYRSRPRADRALLYTDDDDLLDTTTQPEGDSTWEREWMHHHYRRAMTHVRETFEPKSVEVFEHLLAGRRVDEIAAAFGLSTQAVHKIKQRIRDRLRERIARQIHEEEFPERTAPA